MKYSFDIQAIRQDPVAYDNALRRRGAPLVADKIVEYDRLRREAQMKGDECRARVKEFSGLIGLAMKSQDTSRVAGLKDSVKVNKENAAMWDGQVENCESMIEAYLLSSPNLPADDVPYGTSEADNVEVKWWNADTLAMKTRGARDGVAHWDMDLDWGWEAAAKISGSRFSMLGGGLARLHRALGQFMLDQHTDHGFKEIIPPHIVNEAALFGTGQLPKFTEDLFGLEGEVDDFGEHNVTQFLIPTAEVPLTNMHANDILTKDVYRYVALTDCYRAEAGSAGRDTRGLIRQHQFQKVELVTLCEPQRAQEEHEFMTLRAESILELLKLPYRRMLLCSGDMGFSARKTYDLEVWLPGQNAYREISSVSDCGDFQARRLNARYRQDGKTVFASTLNGSGLAVGRTLVAVAENYWLGGDVQIPEMLRPYMGGKSLLSQFAN